MLEGETTQKKRKPKKLFSFTRNQPLPLAQDHLIPLFRLKIRNSAPHFLFFSFLSSPAENGGSGEPLFLLIPSYTREWGFFFILASSPQQWAETHELLSLILPLAHKLHFSPCSHPKGKKPKLSSSLQGHPLKPRGRPLSPLGLGKENGRNPPFEKNESSWPPFLSRGTKTRETPG